MQMLKELRSTLRNEYHCVFDNEIRYLTIRNGMQNVIKTMKVWNNTRKGSQWWYENFQSKTLIHFSYIGIENVELYEEESTLQWL